MKYFFGIAVNLVIAGILFMAFNGIHISEKDDPATLKIRQAAFLKDAEPGSLHEKILPDSIFAPVKKLHSPKVARIDSFFNWLSRHRLFNGTVLFAEDGKIVYENAFGYANFRSRDSLQINSAFQLASVSKPITAISVLILYEEGKLNLDDNVKRFYPQFPYEGITLRLLLTHRSGLPEYMYFSGKYWKDHDKPLNNQEMVRIMIDHKPAIYYKPDYKFNYCNTNFALLAAIVEKVTGEPFEQFVRKNIFEPAGMNHTFIYRKKAGSSLPHKVLGHDRRGRPIPDTYLNGVVGDKGVYSTVEDLFNLDRALSLGRLISIFTLEKAFEPGSKRFRFGENYGFGWRIRKGDEGKMVYHTGWWKGFRSYFIKEYASNKTIIVLSNSARRNSFGTRTLQEMF